MSDEIDVHDLDPADGDGLDEIDGDMQLTLVWCRTHEVYEWHWMPRGLA